MRKANCIRRGSMKGKIKVWVYNTILNEAEKSRTLIGNTIGSSITKKTKNSGRRNEDYFDRHPVLDAGVGAVHVA
jgi:hypothetical protein